METNKSHTYYVEQCNTSDLYRYWKPFHISISRGPCDVPNFIFTGLFEFLAPKHQKSKFSKVIRLTGGNPLFHINVIYRFYSPVYGLRKCFTFDTIRCKKLEIISKNCYKAIL